jgi:hypothetical protein
MGLRQEQMAFVQDVVLLLQKAHELKYEITFGEAERPIQMQELYFKTGKSKTMQSLHLKRLAIDLNIFIDGQLCTAKEIKPLGIYWESLNPKNRWGGSWRGLVEAGKSSFVDSPHFERNA